MTSLQVLGYLIAVPNQNCLVDHFLVLPSHSFKYLTGLYFDFLLSTSKTEGPIEDGSQIIILVENDVDRFSEDHP